MEKKPPYFEHKKFAVVAICFIDILVLITYAALAGLMADDLMLGIANSIRVDNIETAKPTIIAVTVVTCVLSIFFEFVGIIGAMKEHVIMCNIYKIGASIELIIRLIYAIYDIQYWGLVIWQIITFIVAIWYGIDLYRMRRMNAKIECISNN